VLYFETFRAKIFYYCIYIAIVLIKFNENLGGINNYFSFVFFFQRPKTGLSVVAYLAPPYHSKVLALHLHYPQFTFMPLLLTSVAIACP